MRKAALALAIVLLVSLAGPLAAQAVEPRMTTIVPELTFDSNVAKCNVVVTGNNTSEQMVASIKLWQGSNVVKSWEAEGDGYIFFSKTWPVTVGKTYTLTVDLTVNGTAFPRASITNTCE